MARLILILSVMGEAGLVGVNLFLLKNDLYSFWAGLAMLIGLSNCIQAFMIDDMMQLIKRILGRHVVVMPPIRPPPCTGE